MATGEALERGEALDIALAIYAAPVRAADARTRPLPDGMALLLRVAAGEEAALHSAESLIHRPGKTLHAAARFFVQQVLFAPGSEADPWRVLGATPEIEDAQLRRNHRLLVRMVHPDRNDEWDSVFAERVNRAWARLRNPLHRAEAAEQWHRAREGHPTTRGPGRGGDGTAPSWIVRGRFDRVTHVATAPGKSVVIATGNGLDHPALDHPDHTERDHAALPVAPPLTLRLAAPRRTRWIAPLLAGSLIITATLFWFADHWVHANYSIPAQRQMPAAAQPTATTAALTRVGLFRQPEGNASGLPLAIVDESHAIAVAADAATFTDRSSSRLHESGALTMPESASTPMSTPVSPERTSPAPATPNPHHGAAIVTAKPPESPPAQFDPAPSQASVARTATAEPSGPIALFTDFAFEPMFTVANASLAPDSTAPLLLPMIERETPLPGITVPPTYAEASDLLKAFSRHYAEANLPAFLSLFSQSAHTDGGDLIAIANTYARLFESTDTRRIEFQHMRWHANDDQLQGEGRFTVTLKRPHERTVAAIAGAIQLRVTRDRSGIRILEIRHRDDGA